MLNKLASFIEDRKTKRQIAKALSDVNSHLKNIERSYVELENQLTALKAQRFPITDTQLNMIVNRDKSIIHYLRSDNPVSIGSEIEAIFNKNMETARSMSGYSKMNKRFTEIKNKYLSKIQEFYKVQEELNRQIEHFGAEATQFLNDVEVLKRRYIAGSDVQNLQEKYRETLNFFTSGGQVEDERYRLFIELYHSLHAEQATWNSQFISQELKDHHNLLSNIDSKSLDHQQRLAVVTDEDSNLVLAGAGSGKTLTISGKVKYLVDTRRAKPEEILLISFTKKAAEEMLHRITQRLGVQVDVFTFHKLGLSLIAKAKKRKPDVSDEMYEFLELYMKREIYHDKKQLQKLLEFFGFYINIPKDMSDFKTLGDYHEHVSHLDFETLRGKVDKYQYAKVQSAQLNQSLKTIKGQSVKSLEEVLIANFLFLRGVNYEYEQSYEHDTRDEGHRQYKPDFYLPDYDIYIEHFGVNKDMKAPWLSEIEEQKYIEGMQWKRDLHEEHGTILIESFSYYNQQGVLLQKLEENLSASHVQFREVDFKEIFSAIFDQTHNNYLRELVKLICTFLGLFKSNGFNQEKFNEIRQQNRKTEKNLFLRHRTDLFFDLVEPMLLYYEECLSQREAIDFNDMINLATDIVQSGQVRLDYKYIIIDEYQDISNSRFRLVKAIRDQTKAKIMCVGDDWQSIYRFAGSDIKLFTQFEEYFGKHALLRIEKTYRNSQDLIDIAGKFIMLNANQYRKDLRSSKSLHTPIQVFGYQRNIIDALEHAIRNIVSKCGSNAEIMLLGRNNFDVTVLDRSPMFEHKYDRKTDRVAVTYRNYPNLNIFFLTAHRSKGLEADNVILLNAANGLLGFPNKISDDPVLSWVLTDYDQFPFAEERRLFYVALTRTKNRTYILAPDARLSPFVKELTERYGVPYEPIGESNSLREQPHCPKCRTGHLVARSSGNNRFLGCSNYPTCDSSIKNIEVLHNPIECPTCGGYLVKRKGKYGSFYGCTNYPRCNHTSESHPSKTASL